jgi:hypothetical protein
VFIPKINLFKEITKLAWLKRRFDMLHQFIIWLANTVGQSGAIAGDGISYWLGRKNNEIHVGCERRRLDWDGELLLVWEKVK